MRALKAKDIAPFTKILVKMGLKENIKAMFVTSVGDKADKKKDGGISPAELTTELVWGVIENYHKAEKEFFEFLANLEGVPPEAISELPLSDFIELVKELVSPKNLPFFNIALK